MSSEPKFKPGDPVWAQTWPKGKEVAAVVVSIIAEKCSLGHWVYYLKDDLQSGEGCEPYLRPRQDDYQQREPLGHKADLDKPLYDPAWSPVETVK